MTFLILVILKNHIHRKFTRTDEDSAIEKFNELCQEWVYGDEADSCQLKWDYRQGYCDFPDGSGSIVIDSI